MLDLRWSTDFQNRTRFSRSNFGVEDVLTVDRLVEGGLVLYHFENTIKSILTFTVSCDITVTHLIPLKELTF